MSENLPQKYKESFFSKFIKKIKSVFIKTEERQVINSEVQINKKDKSKMQENLSVDINLDIHTEYEKKAFMDKLTKNPNLLENFSNARLEKILHFYLDENEKKKEILRKLSV